MRETVFRAVCWVTGAIAMVLTVGSTAAASGDGDPLELVGVGVSKSQIVIAKQASPSTRYAAEEMQHFLQRITDVRVPVVDDGEAPADLEVQVGRSRRLDAQGLGIDFGSLGAEGYVLRTGKGRLIIAGGEPRGTLYGVYGFLEDHLGCRWFTPELDRVPRRKTLVVPPLNERRVPVFEYRETYTWESYDGDWMARNRLNGAGGRGRLLERQGIRPPVPELGEKHGGSIRFGFGFFVHTLEKIVPAKEYFEAHPEYFAMWQGKRDPSQICCTHERVIALCRDAILRAMREQPDATVFSLSQNDNRKHCQCERCASLEREQGSAMAPTLFLVNRVAEAAEVEFPDKAVETLAYQWTRKPPRTLRPRRNVVIRLCDIECCFAHPLAASCNDRNGAFVEDLKAWAGICQRLWIWDYTTDYSHYLLPFPNKRVLDDNIRLFAKHRVSGVFEQGTYDTPHSELAALKAYLIAKFLWNPGYDESRAIAEFTDAYFGAAAPHVRQYIDVLHDYAEAGQVHVGIFVPPTHPHLTPELLLKANAIWDDAEASVSGDSAALARVRRCRMSPDYAIVEQARAMSGKRGPERTEAQRALIDLAKRRLDPFMATMASSGLTRIREWKDVDLGAYRSALEADLFKQEAHDER